ncbi:hypothetical protein [Bittarella massiliensis (ex Durand et al. 2017)]|uniref:hypothetical protein n=1 Tax=Bittarella massiliensis (ex Durand et al. 2017) TaxID=1720313 RepID=UPI001AA106A4|nr:hypothetical protein [Bittarella massiliensis (ex Durand et al. 2017)]MBO1680325.1 hypothetical protein [Bittarella massiliensis (ex Durand et al. 2017)]
MERKSAHTAKQIYLSALAACLVAALAIAIALTGCGGRAGSAGAADRLAPLEEEVAFLRPAPAAAAFLAGAGKAALEERTALICYAPWEGWESAFPGRSVEATEFQLDGSGGWDGFFPFAIQGEWVYGTRSDHSYFPKTAVWRLNQTTGRGQQLLSSDQFTYLIPPDTPAYSDSNTVAITLSALSEERLFFTVSLGIGMGPGQRRLYSCNLQGGGVRLLYDFPEEGAEDNLWNTWGGRYLLTEEALYFCAVPGGEGAFDPERSPFPDTTLLRCDLKSGAVAPLLEGGYAPILRGGQVCCFQKAGKGLVQLVQPGGAVLETLPDDAFSRWHNIGAGEDGALAVAIAFDRREHSFLKQGAGLRAGGGNLGVLRAAGVDLTERVSDGWCLFADGDFVPLFAGYMGGSGLSGSAPVLSADGLLCWDQGDEKGNLPLWLYDREGKRFLTLPIPLLGDWQAVPLKDGEGLALWVATRSGEGGGDSSCRYTLYRLTSEPRG